MLAVARIGLRRVGLVLLDRRRRVRCAQVLDLRQRPTQAARLDAVRTKVQHLVRTQNVAVLVVEAGTPRSPTPVGLGESLRAVAQEEAAWMQERSVKLALATIGHDAPKASVIAELAAEYGELAARLDLRRASLFRHRDHERDVRPLVHAFVLAHVVGLEASRGATRPAS